MLRPSQETTISTCLQCVKALKGLSSRDRGIFRSSGDVLDVRALKFSMYAGDLKRLQTEDSTAIIVGTLQAALQDMVRPLMSSVYDKIVSLELPDDSREGITALRECLSYLPLPEFRLASQLLTLLHQVATSANNDMDATEVAETMCPYVCRPRGSAFMSIRHRDDMYKLKPAMIVMVRHGAELVRDLHPRPAPAPQHTTALGPRPHAAAGEPHVGGATRRGGRLSNDKAQLSDAGAILLRASAEMRGSVEMRTSVESTGSSELTPPASPMAKIRATHKRMPAHLSGAVPILQFGPEVNLHSHLDGSLSGGSSRATIGIDPFTNVSLYGSGGRDEAVTGRGAGGGGSTGPSSPAGHHDPTLDFHSKEYALLVNLVRSVATRFVESAVDPNRPSASASSSSSSSSAIAAPLLGPSHTWLDDAGGARKGNASSKDDNEARRSSKGAHIGSLSVRRRALVSQCRAQRAEIAAFEREFSGQHGHAPKGYERTPLEKVYASYRDIKRAIRDLAAMDIQRIMRGAIARGHLSNRRGTQPTRRLSSPTLKTASAKARTSASTKASTGEGWGDTAAVRGWLDDVGDAGGSEESNGMDSERGVRSMPSSHASLPYRETSKRPGKGEASASSPSVPMATLNSAELQLKLDDISAQKSQLKRQLKQFDVDFEAKHGRVPQKADKESMRPVYGEYHRLKQEMSTFMQTLKTVLQKEKQQQQQQQQQTSTHARSNKSDRPSSNDAVMETDNNSGTRSEATPASSFSSSSAAPAAAAIVGAETSKRLQDGQSMSVASSADGHIGVGIGVSPTAGASGGGTWYTSEDEDGGGSDTAHVKDSSAIVSLLAEKKNLHMYLKTYERDFQKRHGRPVMKHEDIQPVASEYARYKDLKAAIAEDKRSRAQAQTPAQR